MAAVAWQFMHTTIIRQQGPDSPLKRALGSDFKGKLSPVLYAAGIGAAFFTPILSDLLYLGAALMWLVPDRRIEAAIAGQRSGATPDG